MFVTGQYPPGTVTHTTTSYEQGRDHWQDVHYVRDAPHYPAPAQQIETFTGDFTDPESLEDPVAGSGQGDAQAGSGQGDAQGEAQAGSGQGEAQTGSGKGSAQAGSGKGGAHYGQGGAQAGYGQGGADAGYGLGYGAFWQPVNRQAGDYNLGKVAY
ncbi:circumsporozoite protein-like isoform X2 [Sebastes umbrosus]|uniref:circumsporozoite protein-like isoform X2 n=1 Tax=Sebastes umbrosus TaxID=72105 RepID=UPI00189CB0A5|nr:circumsporozoite protein-like isoform X2 [Sebastes umbrosus]